MRVCVTGGAGFIGSHLADRLLAKGDEVVILDDLSAGSVENLENAEGAELHVGSVTDREYLTDLLYNVDVIYHLATLCLVKGLEDPLPMWEINDLGTFNVCLAAKMYGSQIVFVGTSEMYGPQTEYPIKESNPLNPVSIYGHTKVVAESYVRFFNKIYDVPAVCVRPFNTFGPRQRTDAYAGVITSFSRKMLAGKCPVVFGDGLQTRDFTYVSDIVDGIVMLSRLEHGEIVNLGSGVDVSVLRLFDMINNLTGAGVFPLFAEARPNDLRRLVADNRLAESYGWTPQVSLEDGLKRYLEWLR